MQAEKRGLHAALQFFAKESENVPQHARRTGVYVVRRGPTMTYTVTYGSLAERARRVITTSRMIALALVVTFTVLAMEPAQAQSNDTWKSVAIIGGATAAGAYVGHKIAGSTGAYI